MVKNKRNRRGRKSLLDRIMTANKEELKDGHEQDLEEARRLLKECLSKLREHKYLWIIDYDIPEKRKKTFYRNLKRLRLRASLLEISTRSVLKSYLLKDAQLVKALVEECDGKANIYLAIEF